MSSSKGLGVPGSVSIDDAADGVAAEIEEILAALDAELVGREAVKDRVRDIATLLQLERARTGSRTAHRPLHMSFTGRPGTGRITIALRMAAILHRLGYLAEPRVHVVTRDELLGQFVGHAAAMTREAIDAAAGGVLVIEDVYDLIGTEDDRDGEALAVLASALEDEQGALVVIFAGDTDRMAAFLAANPRLAARVTHHLAFDDYRHDELMEIAELLVAEVNFRFDEEARRTFAEYLTLRIARPNFASARSVRNAIERCRMRQARRLVGLTHALSRQDLITITAEDVRGSSLFAAEDRVEPRSITTDDLTGPR